MYFSPPLRPAILIRRYQRFLADAITPEGQKITLHCANTGAMTGCAEPGCQIWYSTSDNPKRKYSYSWQLTEHVDPITQETQRICVNTHLANQIAKEAIEHHLLPEFSGYTQLRTEVKYGQENSRIDLLLQQDNRPDCYIEIKSVTLMADNHQGYFPDAKTLRGQKHLRELIQIAQSGHRAVLLFVVMHAGIQAVAPAMHIDPVYTNLLQTALEQGVEVLAYIADITTKSLLLSDKRVQISTTASM